MKYILLLNLLIFLLSQSIAMSDTIPDFYQRVIDVSPYDDFIRAKARTIDNGIVLVGESNKDGEGIDGFITKIDSTGIIEWSKTVGFKQTATGFPSENWEFFYQVTESTDGSFIVGCRNVKLPEYTEYPMIIKFDKFGNLLWSKEIIPPTNFENQAIILNIVSNEESLFVLGTMNEAFNQRSFIIEMNLHGEIIWGKQYFNGNHISLPNQILDINENGNLLLYIDIIKRLPTQDFLGCMKLNSLGDIIYIKTYHQPLFENSLQNGANLNKRKNTKINNGYYLNAWLGRENLFDFQRKAALLRIDTLGNLQWAKSYSSSSFIIEGIDDILYTKDDKLLISFNDIYNYYSIGNDADPNESIVISEAESNGILITNKVIDAGGREDYTRMELLTDQSLLLSAKSNSFAAQTQGEWAIHQIKTTPDLDFGDCTPTDSLDIIVEDLEIVQDTFFLESMPFENIQDVDIPVVDADINVIMLCPEGDANLTIKDIFRLNPCESDSLKIKIRVCNTGYTAVGQNVPVAIYDNDPTATASSLLFAQNLPTDLPPTICRDLSLILPMPQTATLHVAINDDATQPTPYDPTLVFGNANFMDSDLTDNIQPFAIVSHEAVFSQLDTTLCAGDTLLIGGASIVAGQADTVFLETFAGCDSVIAVQTTEQLPVLTAATIELCFGDSVLLFGDVVHEAGIYEATFSAFSGCDSVHQVTVVVSEIITADFLIDNEIGSGAMNGAVAIDDIDGGLPPYTYLWNTGDTTANIGNLAQGNYALTITDANECTAVFELMVDLEVSTNETEEATCKAAVVPNPAESTKDLQLFIQTEFGQTISYEIVDVQGRVLLSRTRTLIDQGGNYIPLDFVFQPGIYFLTTSGCAGVIRFVVL